MAKPSASESTPRPPAAGPAVAPEVEEVSGEIVPAEPPAGVERRPETGAVARQAAAVAAGSFAAGLATVAAVRVMGSTRKTRRARRARRALPVVATRSFLVDVHLLDPRR